MITLNIPENLTKTFMEARNQLLDYVNGKMLGKINTENTQVMLDNHRNHISFITTVIQLEQPSLLEKTLPWVYQSYHNQGFSYDYFKIVLETWKEAIKQIITDEDPAPILELYDWMISLHSTNIEISEKLQTENISETLNTRQLEYMEALINGNQRQVFQLTDDYMASEKDLESFYLELVQPAMYAIGEKWERGQISVANEHLASAMLARIMASFYKYVELPEISKGKILISSAANEYHEIGAWMTANIFELRGWDVYYLGANTPVRDLLTILDTFKPDILGLSVTMAYNLKNVEETVKQIKVAEKFSNMKIFLGGKIFTSFPELRGLFDVDYIADTFKDALTIAEKATG